jgi:predicted dehydrogenase
MTARVGVVGCGIIAKVYVEGSAAFDSFDIVACADLDAESANAFADMHGLQASTVDDLIADPSIDVVLNLTPPAAHAAVIGAALDAGKHVYTEKPVTTTVAEGRDLLAEADRRGLRIGCAPDTFLGSAYETARELIARGEIGTPLTATATFLVGGPDNWHPNADVFYRTGGGPMLDIAPYYLTAITSLLGPYRAALGLATTLTSERRFGVGPRAGERFTVDVPTHAVAALELDSGALATVTVSFEAFGQYVSGLVVHGSGGSLELPDANFFGGTVRVRNGDGEWKPVQYESPGPKETRGLGLDEMLAAIRDERPHRASGALGLHVLETALAALRSAEEGRLIEIGAPAAVQPVQPR